MDLCDDEKKKLISEHLLGHSREGTASKCSPGIVEDKVYTSWGNGYQLR